MLVSTAIDLVEQIIYFADWEIKATDHTDRYESCIMVTIKYPTWNTNRDQAEQGFPNPMKSCADFPIVIAECDELSLYRQIIERIFCIMQHEGREAFRVKPTEWAPFHPHKIDGMKRWGTFDDDLHFGIA